VVSLEALLSELRTRGATVTAVAGRLRVEAPKGAVPPELQAAVAARKADLLVFLGTRRPVLLERYRALLADWWQATADGPTTKAPVATLYQELIRLGDDVGEPAATELRRAAARDWYRVTGRCPWCGERGPYHAPENEGEAG
jgi:hypothetical protein